MEIQRIRDVTMDEILSQCENISTFVLDGITFYGSNKWNQKRFCGWCKKEFTFRHPEYMHFLCGEFKRCKSCNREYCGKCITTQKISLPIGGMMTRRYEYSGCILCEKSWMYDYTYDTLLTKALEKLGYTREQFTKQVSEDFLEFQAKKLQHSLQKSLYKNIPTSILKIVVRLRDDKYNKRNTELLEYIGI